jgi:hypothetical protein
MTTPTPDFEHSVVAELAELIGYARLLGLVQASWRASAHLHGVPGSEGTVGPCAAFLVPCPCTTELGAAMRDNTGHCEWCCGTRRVTERVEVAITGLLSAGIRGA